QDDNLNLIFIDFGLSQFSQKPEDKAVDLYVLERAIKSAHIGMELLLNKAFQAYKEGGKDAENVLLRLEEVRMRGRKRDWRKLGSIIQYMHSAGLIHADLTTSTVLIKKS
uniref:non-specific serine/threonine protein kinase n=1 Tax=Meloidogyne javanica TaxID=6303 RepID=A0A915MIS5_MELJA